MAVVAVWAFRDAEPSPQVRRLLPEVVLFLEHKDPLSLYLAQKHPPSKWTLFCGVRYLGNSPPREQFNLYVWEVCEAYRPDGKRLAIGSGWSAPAVIWIVKRANGYGPEAEFQLYTDEAIPRMFPEALRGEISDLSGSRAIAAMDADLKRRACSELLSTPKCRAHY